MICAGLDAGSRATKVVLFDCDNKRILAQDLADQGVDQERLASDLLDRACSAAKINRSDLKGIIATGYGRNRIGFANSTITEITCHAKGVHHLCPQAQTIIEIGGQDSKVILLDNEGKVRDFSMTPAEAEGGRPVCIIGNDVATNLFRNESPLGEKIMLDISSRDELVSSSEAACSLAPSARDWLEEATCLAAVET